MTEMQRISTREGLITLMNDIGVSPDWHEPDQQDVTAAVHGRNFDNAGFWPLGQVGFTGADTDLVYVGIPDIRPTPSHAELHVTLQQDGKPVAVVNLASLFAWATGLCGHVSPGHCQAEAAEKGYGA